MDQMWYVKEIEESKVIPILRMELLSTKRRLWWNSFWEKKIEFSQNVGFGALIRHPTGDDSQLDIQEWISTDKLLRDVHL